MMQELRDNMVKQRECSLLTRPLPKMHQTCGTCFAGSNLLTYRHLAASCFRAWCQWMCNRSPSVGLLHNGMAHCQVVEKPPFFMKPTDRRKVIHVNFFAASVRCCSLF